MFAYLSMVSTRNERSLIEYCATSPTPTWKITTFILFQPNISPKHLIEIGPRGMLEDKQIIRTLIGDGARFISTWHLRQMGINAVCEALDHAYSGTDAVYAHFDMDVIGGAGPAPGDILGELVEPIAMTDYEVIRIAHEVGRRGLTGFSFICIPPGSAAVYRVIVSIIVYMAAGLAMRKIGKGHG